MNKLFLVEIIRYGNPKLGVQPFGVFDDIQNIHKTMKEYNQYRGGKYPAYYVTECSLNEEESLMHNKRTMYDLEQSDE
jgi:hypothetical protein